MSRTTIHLGRREIDSIANQIGAKLGSADILQLSLSLLRLHLQLQSDGHKVVSISPDSAIQEILIDSQGKINLTQ